MSGDSPTDPVSPIHEEATILGNLDVHRPDTPTADDRATGVADLAEFRAALIEIGLFEETELDVLASAVPESEGVLGLARILQQAGRLTRYQAAALYQRKSRGLLIGNYLILDKLGAGGMGMVFKARHRKLGRVVALKILPPSFAREKSAVLRFKREIEAAGRLKHPNIVAALDADEDRGVHFLVMEYVEGSDLDHVVRHRGQLPLAQAIDFLIQAARGLEAAHAQGIVHRDIKPSNLMLDGAGTVRVLDLGLALIAEESNPFGQAAGTRLTASGMYMGTVDYMAPEQAEDARKADHRADIYSLGCTLYYLLTGREPFVGDTVLKRLMAHQERPAPMLKVLRPDAPTPLEDVYQRMMAKRPADRPASMTDLIRLLEMCRAAVAEALPPKSSARLMVFDEGSRKTEKGASRPPPGRDASVFADQDDSEGFQVGSELDLEDLAIDVRSDVPLGPPPMPPIRRAVKPRAAGTAGPIAGGSTSPAWRRPLAVILPVAAVVLGGFVVFFAWSHRTSGPPLTTSGRGSESSQEIIDGQERPASDPGRKPAFDPPLSPRRKEPIAEMEPLVEVGRLTGHDHPHVDHVHVLRDGKTLLTTCSDGKARVWDLASGRELRRFCHPTGLRPAAIHPDGRHVLTGCNDGVVRLWDLQTGEGRPIIKHDGRVWAVAISPDGTSALSAGDFGVVRVSDLKRGGEIRRFETHNAWDWSVAFSPDGRRALTGSGDGVVWLADLTRNDPPVPLRGQPEFAFGVAFAPDGRHAASSAIGQITYWDLETRRGVRVPIGAGHVPSIEISADGRRIWFATNVKASNGAPLDQGVIGFWDTDGRSPPTIVNRGHGSLGMDLLPDGGIVTADLDGVARIWRPSRSLERARKLDADGQDEAALAEYGSLIAARPDDARLLIERGRLLDELGRPSEADADYARAARLAPDNPQIFLETAGWWIAGPYPPDLKVPIAFQIDKSIDPSKPAPSVGTEPRQWRRAPIEMQGNLDLRKASNADNAAAYALAIFDCPTEREVVLLWGIDDEMAFYLNGQHILEDVIGYSPFGTRLSLVRIKAGRNTILAKVVNGRGPHCLNLMISQAPADFLRAHVRLVKRWKEAVEDYQRARARDPSSLEVDLYRDGGTALGETGRWSEAVAAWRRVVELDPATEHHQEQLVAAYLGAGDLAAVSRITRMLIKKEGPDRPNARLHKEVNADLHNRLCWTIALNPEGMYGARPYVMLPQRRGGDRPEDATALLTAGAVEYRAGQFEPSVSHLNSAIKARKGKDSAFDWVFLAMVRRRLQQPEARQALARARELAKDPSMEWYQRVEIEHLLEEAEHEPSVPVPSTPPRGDPRSALKNPGFEAPTPLEGWECVTYGAAAQVALDDQVLHEGRRSVRITARAPSDTALGQETTLTPLGRYRFTGWVKSQGLDPMKARVCGTYQIQRPRGEGTISGGPNHRGNTDWTRVVLDFQVPPDGRVRVSAFFVGFGEGRGTAWFDGLTIERLDAVRGPVDPPR